MGIEGRCGASSMPLRDRESRFTIDRL